MNSSNNSFRILSRQILPAIAAVSLMATSAQADSAGASRIDAAIKSIPGLATKNAITAKPNDLIHALCLALDHPSVVTPSAIVGVVEAALETVGGKARKDKDKIAGQIIATAIANNNITDPTLIAQITTAVFNVNNNDLKLGLKATGKAVALAGALKASSPAAAAAIGTALGGAGAGEFAGTPADVAILLANTAKALGTSAPKAGASLETFVQGFLTDEFATDADRKTQAIAAAEKAAAKTPAAAGGILGGYVGTLGAAGDGALATLAGTYVTNTKLAKALGDVLARTMDGHTNQSGLFTTLAATANDKASVAQGLIRAGSVAEASETMTAFLLTSPDQVKTAGVVAAGNGDNETKLTAIVTSLATGQDSVKKTAIGAAVISSVGVLNPESADAAITALIATGGFGDATSRNTLGAAIAPKVKAYSAVGYMAAGIAELNIGAATGATARGIAVTSAAAIMAKASKAATDVVYRTAELSAIASKVDFADELADASSKLALNVAVGASLASQSESGAITARVINHNGLLDKSTLAKAPKIAAAVATAVDEERAAEILFSVGSLISEKGTVAGKPLKASAFKVLAKSLAVAIQKKPNVLTTNRADELGELAAVLTDAVISAFGPLTDPKKIKARDKAIAAVGGEVLKALSKKPVEESKALVADKSSSADVAGSVALTIRNSGMTIAQRDALLAPGGALEKALAKLAGKAGTPHFTGVQAAIASVKADNAAALAGYEDGTLRNGAALSDLFNDKETDKRNR